MIESDARFCCTTQTALGLVVLLFLQPDVPRSPHPGRNDDTNNYNYIHCTIVSRVRHLVIRSAITKCIFVYY